MCFAIFAACFGSIKHILFREVGSDYQRLAYIINDY